MKNHELLAPAGTFPMLIAAVEAGADAVYFGIRGFNMRTAAKNFEIKDLKEIGKICYSQKKAVKKYVTLNTIIYQSELKEVERIIKQLKGNIDAVICSDLAVIMLCKKYEVSFHISTQCSVSNAAAAEFYRELGAERIVLARELSLSQIKIIADKMSRNSGGNFGIECFCHGAMCVSESGRCFTSQFLCEKSANRGECVQPCRRAYRIIEIDDNPVSPSKVCSVDCHAPSGLAMTGNMREAQGESAAALWENELVIENNRVMSAKDLCTLPFIGEMKRAGITSFKIEGRNRTPEYVSVVTKTYRKALDKDLSAEEAKECLENLKKVYNRGFSSGFYIRKPTAQDLSSADFGEQTEKKEFVGKIVKYWSKAGVAALKMNHGVLKIGDEIYIIGNATGLLRVKLESMQIDLVPVLEVRKGEEVGIKVPRCRVNDEVYLIVRRC